MDLRDQFAIAALQGELASQREGCEWANEKSIASRAYEIADAMIAEREKDDVETRDKIKQMLVEAIKEAHPDLHTSTVYTGKHLIFQLTTGLQF